MNGLENSNGHDSQAEEPPRLVNPYTDAITRSRPEEIVDFEMNTDPYANMLPGISNIRAARTIGRGLEVGRKGNRLIMAVSVLLILVLILPAILTIISQLAH